MPGKSYSGWIYFCLPDGETKAMLTYGDHIEITIDLDENGEFFDKDTAPGYYKGNFGETIQTKKLEIVFDKWGAYTPTMVIGSGEKFIKFHVTFTNISNSDVDVGARIYCYDANGAEYGSNSIWLTDEDEAQRIDGQEIAPGKSYSGWYYFEIPESVNELTIMPFTNVEISIDLTEVENEGT